MEITRNRAANYLLRVWELAPKKKIKTELGDIYIAEQWHTKRYNVEDGKTVDYGPGWTVMWAVNHRGPCIAQPIYMKSTALPDQRQLAARVAAEQYLRVYNGMSPHDGEAQAG